MHIECISELKGEIEMSQIQKIMKNLNNKIAQRTLDKMQLQDVNWVNGRRNSCEIFAINFRRSERDEKKNKKCFLVELSLSFFSIFYHFYHLDYPSLCVHMQHSSNRKQKVINFIKTKNVSKWRNENYFSFSYTAKLRQRAKKVH